MATKSIVPWPPGHLTTDQCYANADALSDIVRTLSGNAAALKGYIGGGEQIDTDTPNTAPLSPGQSLPGHDHSGGMFGRPFFVSLAQFSLNDHTHFSGNWSTTPVHNGFVFSLTANQAESIAWSGRMPLWVPGCDPGTYGAYQGLGIKIVGENDAATNIQTGDALTVRIQNQATGDTAELTLTTPTAAVWTIQSSADSSRLTTKPGAVNVLTMDVEFDTTATAASRSLTARVIEIELGVFST